MPGPRMLWTGPYGAAPRGRAIERASVERRASGSSRRRWPATRSRRALAGR